MIEGITQAIDDLASLRSIRQLQIDTKKAKEAAKELEAKRKVQEMRLEQAKIRIAKIESDEIEKCKKTAEVLKEFERKSSNAPFFESLLEVFNNFQGIHL